MDSTRPSFGTRLLRAFRNLVLASLFVGLALAATYALSLVNSRTYRFEARSGHLVVLKGRLLPTGAEPWQPADPGLAQAFAPLPLEGNTPAVLGQKFSDREELDQAYFSVLELLAGPRVNSDVPTDFEKAVGYVRRAEKLTYLSEAQRESLKKLRSALAFQLAQQRLEESRAQLEDALVQLKLAAETENRHRAEANVVLMAVEPQVKLLSTTLRTATAMSQAGQGQLDVLVKQLDSTSKQFEALTKPAPDAAPKAEATTPKPDAPTPPATPEAPLKDAPLKDSATETRTK